MKPLLVILVGCMLACMALHVTCQTVAPAMDEHKIWPPAFDPALLGSNDGCSTTPLIGKYRTFHVGPGQQHTELTTVPWLSLQAGDVVNIYYRSTPYRNWIGYRAVANATHPVTINGVTDSKCNRPVISGSGAVPTNDAKANSYASSIVGYGVILIWKLPADSWEHVPKYLSLRNLEITAGREGYNYTGYDGTVKLWGRFVGGIYAVRIQHLLVHNCHFRQNGIGIFTNSKGQFNGDYSSHLVLRSSRFVESGYSDSSTEHNLYLQGKRVLVEGCYVGQAAGGSSLKDRSSATVIRYNYVVASARALDLVETEEEDYDGVRLDPLYPHAFVYGNVFLNDMSLSYYSGRPIHFGCDNNPDKGRFGSLFFYGNTFSYRTVSGIFATSVFQLGNEYLPENVGNLSVIAWDNAFTNQNTPDTITEFRMLSDVGKISLRGINYLPTGFLHTTTYLGLGVVETTSEKAPQSKVIVGPATVIEGSSLLPDIGSPLIGVGNSFTPDYSILEQENSDFRKENLERIGEYWTGSSSSIAGARLKSSSVLNIGAY